VYLRIYFRHEHWAGGLRCHLTPQINYCYMFASFHFKLLRSLQTAPASNVRAFSCSVAIFGFYRLKGELAKGALKPARLVTRCLPFCAGLWFRVSWCIWSFFIHAFLNK
jgi:hypothetical protein